MACSPPLGTEIRIGRERHSWRWKLVPNSPTDRRPIGQRKSAQRSRVANGSAILSGVDQRSVWCRRLKENLQDHLSDIPNASISERSIIRRASVLEVELERMETAFAIAGEASAEDLDIYARVSANLRRLLESVGLERRAKPVNGLTLGEVLRADIDAQREPPS
jgi:hypothetical protein